MELQQNWSEADVRCEMREVRFEIEVRSEIRDARRFFSHLSQSHNLTSLKASSLVEVIVAMTIIILVMTITFSLITQVYKNSTNEIELRKQIHIQTSLSETFNNQAFISRKYEYPELEIQQEIKNDSSKKTNQVLSMSVDTTFVIKTLVATQGR